MPILSHICRQTVRVTRFLCALLVCFLPYLVDRVSDAELASIALPSVSLPTGEESERDEPAAGSGRLHESMLIQYVPRCLHTSTAVQARGKILSFEKYPAPRCLAGLPGLPTS